MLTGFAPVDSGQLPSPVTDLLARASQNSYTGTTPIATHAVKVGLGYRRATPENKLTYFALPVGVEPTFSGLVRHIHRIIVQL